MKPLLIITFIIGLLILLYFFLPESPKPIALIFKTEMVAKENKVFAAIRNKATSLNKYISQKKFSDNYVFLIDMSLPSGKKRFFIYDLLNDSIINSGLVAHGNCRSGFLEEPVFSNVPECGCSSVGKYKIGYAYQGKFGKAFKLHGLDSTNFNAFNRSIVLHAYDCVPDEQVYPQPICNSLGCPMISYRFLNSLTSIIESSSKPILLWIYH